MDIKVLVADDDSNIRMITQLYLRKEGYQTEVASDGMEAARLMEEKKINCAVIDIMMPGLNGWELCKTIKRYYDIPILMLTARGEMEDKIKGFNLGADDYLTKPFHPLELVMRVKSLLRRYKTLLAGKLEIDHIILDSRSYQIKIGDDRFLLPAKQFELLYTLVSFPGKIFTRDQLIEKIWGLDYEGDERTVDTHIKKLRKHLSGYENRIKIVTVRGLGYKVETSQC